MNLVKLYEQTPVERHGDIKVVGDRVFVKGTDSSIDEYILGSDGELWPIRSDRGLKQALEAIKGKLGIKE